MSLSTKFGQQKIVERKIEKKKLIKRPGTLGESRDKNQKTQKNNVVKNYKIKTQRRLEKVDKSN